MPETQKTRRRSRATFWMLLCVSILCSVIIALVLPAIQGSLWRENAAAVSAELIQLSQALEVFKAEYGAYPPSHLTISEDGERWNSDDRATLRQIWPQFDFTAKYDLNSDGDTDDVHVMTGAECLVFFLGGNSNKNGTRIGFSKNPLTPFSNTSPNRSGPFFEFQINRFTDLDEDGFAEYGDPLTQNSYLYASRRGGAFWNEDLPVYPNDDPRNLKSVYNVNAEFQIISAGFDGAYGIGGDYFESAAVFQGDRAVENDNIANFSVGAMGENPPVGTLTFTLLLFSPMALFLAGYFISGLVGIRRVS